MSISWQTGSARPLARLLPLILALFATSIVFYIASHIRPASSGHRVANPRAFWWSAKQAEVDGVVVSPPPPPADTEEYLALCLLVKDDASLLNEYLVHHYFHHGIRRFYIYDDGSSPRLSKGGPEVIVYNVPKSVLTFEYINPKDYPDGPKRESIQQKMMGRCIDEHGPKHHWLGLFDIDEFLEMRSPTYPNAIEWLKEWEVQDHVGAVAISSLPHNSAGYEQNPDSDFRKSYTTCVTAAEIDWRAITQVKLFVRPHLVSMLPLIHTVWFTKEAEALGVITVDEYGNDASGNISRIENTTWDYAAIHHYATGSREFFEEKKKKGRAQGKNKEGVENFKITQKYWAWYHESVEEVDCLEMTQYVP